MLSTSTTLLDRLRQPDQADAWQQFDHLYRAVIVAWAKRQGLQEADAADVTQNVLLKLVGLLPAYQRGSGQKFRGWLAQVTRNECIDFRRRRATRALPPADGLSDAEGPQPESDPSADLRALVHRGLGLIRGDFAEATWAAFTAVMLHGRPVAAVAAELGLTETAVYLARHRVLTRLRHELDGLLD